MRRRVIVSRQSVLAWLAIAGLVALQVQLLAPFSKPATTQSSQSSVEANYAKLPLAFEPNQGQADSTVDFLVHHGQAVTAFSGTSSTTSVGGKQITMSLDGANNSSFTGQDELPSKTNYFLGNDQSQWHSDIPNFQKLIAKNVYAGIDLAYYGTNSTLEHDFIVNPGSDYHQIAFNFTGQDNLTQDADGNLVFKAGDDELRLNAPTTYQLGDHEKHTIPSKFELHDNTVTVAVAPNYDPNKPLVIDPTLSLIYSTYLGGSGDDQGFAIAVDQNGSAYIAGQTTSTNYPTSSPYQGSNAGGAHDVFVTKLNATGSAPTYSTYLGGAGDDLANGIAVDSVGSAYVVGSTKSANFPTASAFQSSLLSVQNAYLTKLNTTGSALTYSTYFRGTSGAGTSLGRAVAVGSDGSAFIAGQTTFTTLPTTVGAFQTTFTASQDAYVAKFTPTGAALTYATYLAGSAIADDNAARGLAIDSSGNAYVAGYTNSTSFPTVSPIQAASGGNYDGFLTKLNAAGSALMYSTYIGGSGSDQAGSVAVDASGNAYVQGITASTNFPTSAPIQASLGGGSYDAFVTKVNAAGSAYVYATYLGGSGAEGSTDEAAIAVDGAGNAYVVGGTSSTNFPVTSSGYQTTMSGTSDAYVTAINPTGSALVYSTFVGGSDSDGAVAVAVGLNGDAYVVGATNSTNFPTQSPFQASNAGGTLDAFVFQLTQHVVNLTARVDPTLTFAVGSTTCALGTLSTSQTQQCTYTLTAATNGTSGYSISYLPVVTLTSGANTILALTSPTASTLNTEQFGINLAANTAAGSHTASSFGAAPSGGSGVASANYTTANSFKLATGGETIATASAPSLSTTYTVSTIANITNTTEAGAYTTTFTYNIVSTY